MGFSLDCKTPFYKENSVLNESTRRYAASYLSNNALEQSVKGLSKRLNAEGIDYCIVGGNALAAHGFKRQTNDVDVLLKKEDYAKFIDKLVGRGLVPRFPDAKKSFWDTTVSPRIPIDVLVEGSVPGNGVETPNCVRFPVPKECSFATEIDGVTVNVIDLPNLISLKIASYLTEPKRVPKDKEDVKQLITVTSLSANFCAKLYPQVREEFTKLLQETKEDQSSINRE